MRPAELYDILHRHFGPQHWWPGDSPFEIIVGAILTQQASWSNVEMAIANLKNAGMLAPERIANADPRELEELIRPSGFFRHKAVYLQAFCLHLMREYQGELDAMFSRPLDELRPELLALRGIGPETADSILLYAGGKRTFVVDAYTVRICQRTGLHHSKGYHETKMFFENNIKPDVTVYNEFHALFVALGKKHCTARSPKCPECPVISKCQYSK